MPEQTAARRGFGLTERFPADEAEEPACITLGPKTRAWPRDTAAAAGHPSTRRDPFPRKDGRSARACVTARGAIIAMLALFLACDLVTAWLHVEVITGLGYVGGCVIMPYLVRRHALLQVVVAPPALFLAALVAVQALTAQGSSRHGRVLSVLEGTAFTLAAIAPWLLAGTALAMAAGLRRGLRATLRELSADLRAAQQAGPRQRS